MKPRAVPVHTRREMMSQAATPFADVITRASAAGARPSKATHRSGEIRQGTPSARASASLSGRCRVSSTEGGAGGGTEGDVVMGRSGA